MSRDAINLNMEREDVSMEDISSRLSHKKVCNVKLKRNQNTLNKALNVINELVKSGRLHAEGEYEIIHTPERLKEFMETYVNGIGEYVLDVETTGLDVYNDILVGICLYNPDLPSAYVPFNHTDLQNRRVEGQMTEEECKEVMLPYLANENLKCINHNIKFDDKVVTFQWGQRIANVWWDTYIAGWVLNENEGHGLKPMYNKYILDGKGSDEDFGDLFEGIPCNYIPIDIFAIYGANDGFKTWALYQFQKQFLREDHPRKDYRNLYYVFREIEMPLIDVCMDMELRGVEIREDYAKELSEKFNQEMEEKEKLCDEYVAQFDEYIKENPTLMRLTKGTGKINYNSPQQVACLLYDIFKLKSVSRKEPRGTGDKIIQQHRNKAKKAGTKKSEKFIEFLNNYQRYKECGKLLGTYIDKIPAVKCEKTNAVHTSFNQYGARCITGDSLIPTDNGYLMLEGMVGDAEWGELEEKSYTIVNKDKCTERSTNVIRYKNQPTLKVSLSYGIEIEGTYNHPVMSNQITSDEYLKNHSDKVKREFYGKRLFKPLQELKVGDYVEIPLGYNVFSTEYQPLGVELRKALTWNTKEVTLPDMFNEDFAEFLGMYFADGSIHDGNGSFTIRISNDDPDVIERVKELSEKLFSITPEVRWEHTTFASEITSIQLEGLKKYLHRGAHNKKIPKELFLSPKNVVQAFIRGLTLDSSFDADRERLSITMCNRYNISFVQQVLFNMGIVCNISQRADKKSYRLSVVAEDYGKFLSQIGVIQKCKVGSYKETHKVFVNGGSLWVRVLDIQTSFNDVYDLHVPDTHSFISNGVISHNTGRFSSSDTVTKINLQNIPSHEKSIRKIFKARDGYKLVGGDFSQIEPRVLAYVSGDEAMQNAYKEGKDLYAIMGSQVYKLPYEDCREFYPDGTVNAEGKHRRTTMKSVLLGIMYERGAKAIGEQFDKSAQWAQELIDNFYKSFPKIQQLRLKTEKMAEEYGYVTTVCGRKRRLPDMQLSDHDDYRYQEAHRQSLNSVIQGSSADIMKLSMIALYRDPKYKELDCHMLITVHDELIMEVPEENVKAGAELLVNTMKRVGHSLIDLPMNVDAEVNDCWYGENLAEEYGL